VLGKQRNSRREQTYGEHIETDKIRTELKFANGIRAESKDKEREDEL
jgi:hypothetical protein